MKVTRDEAFRLIDQFTDYIEGMVGEDVAFKRNPDVFSVEILRKQKRVKHVRPTTLLREEDIAAAVYANELRKLLMGEETDKVTIGMALFGITCYMLANAIL